MATTTSEVDLALALNTHAVAIDNNVVAMNEFFNLSVEDVGQISAIMLISFIIGNSIGRISKLLRN